MQVGILTLPLRTNYGGILQAYALQTVLERQGHKVIVIDTSPYKSLPLWKMPFSYSKRLIKKIIYPKTTRIFVEQWHNQAYPIISQYIQLFIDSYIHRKEIKGVTELQNEDFEAIVVGSDQVWRPSYNSHIEHAFLDFAKEWTIKRIAYAPSFGKDIWEYTSSQTQVCASLIRLFDAVSVREISGIKLCEHYLHRTPSLVLDPTFLLSVEDYCLLFKKAHTSLSPGNLLTYILDDTSQKRKLLEKIGQETQLHPFRINAPWDYAKYGIDNCIQPPVEQWLRGFYDASLVVTDSFHACVFSIIFNKPFIVLENKERGNSRLQSLLSLFGLNDRLVCEQNSLLNLLRQPINWESVNEKKQALQKRSMDFLNNAFN